MRFGRTLRESIYKPWASYYIDYSKLKLLLRDDDGDNSDSEGGVPGWTEDDENRFCDEIFNVQLEKVAAFQEDRVRSLRERADAIFDKLRELTPVSASTSAGSGATSSEAGASAAAADKDKERSEITVQRVREIEAELDSIINELRELKRYSSLNYTGFLKIAKKHDRKRGLHYRVRPMMQVSLTRRPFNSEAGYTPLLAKLSLMYEAVHQYLSPDETALPADLDPQQETTLNGERYTASKCMFVLPSLTFFFFRFSHPLTPSLGTSRQPARGQDHDPPASARARLQRLVRQGCRRDGRPDADVAVL